MLHKNEQLTSVQIYHLVMFLKFNPIAEKWGLGAWDFRNRGAHTPYLHYMLYNILFDETSNPLQNFKCCCALKLNPDEKIVNNQILSYKSLVIRSWHPYPMFNGLKWKTTHEHAKWWEMVMKYRLQLTEVRTFVDYSIISKKRKKNWKIKKGKRCGFAKFANPQRFPSFFFQFYDGSQRWAYY